MNWIFWVVNWCLQRIFRTVCCIDMVEIQKLPRQGPLILVSNHVNFLEAPVLMPHINNPNLTAIAKRESWDNPLFYLLFNLWRIIPIDRDMVDREAFRQSLQALGQGKILAVFPEGTRSVSGELLRGKPGVVAIAMRSQAPIIAVACYGHESFWENLKHLRRTDFHVVVSEPFRLNLGDEHLSRETRQIVTDEIMYKLAELLPEKYRGIYQCQNPYTYKYLVSA